MSRHKCMTVINFCAFQVCQVSAQQPVQTELLMRYHQLQSRLATLRIENEEVRIITVTTFSILSWTLSCYSPLYNNYLGSASDVAPTRPFTDCDAYCILT